MAIRTLRAATVALFNEPLRTRPDATNEPNGNAPVRMSTTLSIYIARKFALATLTVLGGMLLLAYLIELIELLRRASGNGLPLTLALEMAALRLALLAQKIAPFAALFGAGYTFVRMTRSNELIVARAAGVSVWQFLMPPLILATAFGALIMGALNPLGSATISRFQELEARHLDGQTSLLAVSATGMWLRQRDEIGQSVIHAQRVTEQGTLLHDVTVYSFAEGNRFARRIDAADASLRDGFWRLRETTSLAPDGARRTAETLEIPTTLTLREIQNSFAPPETLSFWELPRFIAGLEEAGFTAVRHRLHWHASLALPALLASMIVLSACFTLRLTRRGGTAWMLAAGVGAGFMFYVLQDVAMALGQTGGIPVTLAVWAPPLALFLLGSATLLHLEDG